MRQDRGLGWDSMFCSQLASNRRSKITTPVTNTLGCSEFWFIHSPFSEPMHLIFP